jgi:hypothetical protein
MLTVCQIARALDCCIFTFESCPTNVRDVQCFSRSVIFYKCCVAAHLKKDASLCMDADIDKPLGAPAARLVDEAAVETLSAIGFSAAIARRALQETVRDHHAG